MKLFVCWGTFQTPRPGGHPCHNAHAALRMAGQLAWFWYLRSHLSVGRACLEQVVAAGGDAPPAVHSFALAGLGQMSLYQGDLGVAEDAFARALALAQANLIAGQCRAICLRPEALPGDGVRSLGIL